MKNLTLAAPIFEYTAERFIEKVDETEDTEDLNVWLSSPGGSVFAGWSIIGRCKKREGSLNITVIGHAASMAFLFTAYGDHVEAIDVAKFMVHRASGYVRNEDDQKILDDVNNDLLAKLKKRIDSKKFKELTGTTLDKLWKAEEKRDVWLSAKEAKEIGLVDKIIRLDPKKMEALTDPLVAYFEPSQGSDDTGDTTQGSVKTPDVQGSTKEVKKENNNSQIKKKMNKQEFKAQHLDVHNEVYADGKTAGITSGETEERNRVQSWMAFLDVDKERVLKAIKDGDEFTTAIQAEMLVKMTAKKETTDTETDSAGEVKTKPTDGKKPEAKDLEKFETEVDEGVNVKNHL